MMLYVKVSVMRLINCIASKYKLSDFIDKLFALVSNDENKKSKLIKILLFGISALEILQVIMRQWNKQRIY